MRILRRLILVIGLVLTASCSTPTTPAFPQIACPITKLSSSELAALSSCQSGLDCIIPHTLLKKLHQIVQDKSACLEQYKAAASKFKGD